MIKIYRKRTWQSKNKKYIVQEIYHSWRALPSDPKVREQRLPRKDKTDVSQEERNRRHKRDRLTRLLLDNFEEGDKYLTFTFRDGPPSVEEIKEAWKKIKRQLRDKYKRARKEFQYVAVIECLTGGGRPHGHIIIKNLEGITVSKIQKLWGRGFVTAKEYGGTIQDARNIAAYFTKSKTERFNSPIQTSKNLIRSEPKVETVKRSETYYEHIRTPKGYIPVEVDGWSAEGFTEEGFAYRRAIFELVEKAPPRRKKRRERMDDDGKKRGSSGADKKSGAAVQSKKRNLRGGDVPVELAKVQRRRGSGKNSR